MLGELDAQNTVLQTINEISHILIGRSEAKSKKTSAFGRIFNLLKVRKK